VFAKPEAARPEIGLLRRSWWFAKPMRKDASDPAGILLVLSLPIYVQHNLQFALPKCPPHPLQFPSAPITYGYILKGPQPKESPPPCFVRRVVGPWNPRLKWPRSLYARSPRSSPISPRSHPPFPVLFNARSPLTPYINLRTLSCEHKKPARIQRSNSRG